MQLRCRHCRAARAVLVHPEKPGARVRFPAVGRISLPVLPSRDERRRRAKHVRPEEPQGGARLFVNTLPCNNQSRDGRGRGSWWPVAAHWQGALQRSRRSAAAQQKERSSAAEGALRRSKRGSRCIRSAAAQQHARGGRPAPANAGSRPADALCRCGHAEPSKARNRGRAGKGCRFVPSRGAAKHGSPGPAGSGWLPLPACQCRA